MPKKQYDIDFYDFIEDLGLHTFTVNDVTKHLLERYPNDFDKKKNAVDWHPNRSTHLRRIGST